MTAPVRPLNTVIVRLVANPDPSRFRPMRALLALAALGTPRSNPKPRQQPDDAIACPS